jgi:hypothetical protein
MNRTISGYHAGRSQRRDVKILTSDYSLDPRVDNGVGISNKGATGKVEVSLGPAEPGRKQRAYVEAAEILALVPESDEKMSLPSGVAQVAGKYIAADAVGEFIEIECITSGLWSVVTSAGTWTVESE